MTSKIFSLVLLTTIFIGPFLNAEVPNSRDLDALVEKNKTALAEIAMSEQFQLGASYQFVQALETTFSEAKASLDNPSKVQITLEVTRKILSASTGVLVARSYFYQTESNAMWAMALSSVQALADIFSGDQVDKAKALQSINVAITQLQNSVSYLKQKGLSEEQSQLQQSITMLESLKSDLTGQRSFEVKNGYVTIALAATAVVLSCKGADKAVMPVFFANLSGFVESVVDLSEILRGNDRVRASLVLGELIEEIKIAKAGLVSAYDKLK